MKVSARSQPFNAVERQFAAAYHKGAHFTSPKTKQQIRQRMKEVAYHEAGHVAAQAFTGFEWSHIVSASIIPTATTLGRVTGNRSYTENCLSDFPMPFKQSMGWMMLLRILGGRGAEKRFVGEDYEEEIVDSDSDELYEEGTDIYRAYAVAGMMCYPRMPYWRILSLAGRWTKEMMDLPAVWKAVENFAQLLLERGVIEDLEILHAAFGDIYRMSWKLPRWYRRLKCDEKSLVLNGLPAAAS